MVDWDDRQAGRGRVGVGDEYEPPVRHGLL